MIRRSLFDLPPPLFRQLYKTLLLYLTWNTHQVLWSPKLRKTKKIERRLPETSNTDSRRVQKPPISKSQAVNDMVEVYKHLHNYDRTTIPERFSTRTLPSRNHNFELERIFEKDGMRGVQTNFSYVRRIKQWNTLPREVEEAPSIIVFTKRLDHSKISSRFVNKNDSQRPICGLYP